MAGHQPLLIRGGAVLDGSGRDAVVADVRLRDGLVTEVRPDLAPEQGEEAVDASGLVVAPGFVDMHSHSDLYAMVRPGAGAAPVGDAPKLLQGVTLQVFGQDGISAAPVAEDDLADYAHYIAALDGHLDPSDWSWREFGQYLDALRGSSALRVAGLVGHSTVRRLVMGMAARPPTDAELDAMRDAVDLAMRQGALGLSTGLVYAPAAYSSTDELIALCEVVARHAGRLFIHVRSESDRVVEASEEALEVARRSGVHLHYSHIKTAGRTNWHRAEKILEMIEEYRRSGVAVTTDVHPYTAGSTTAHVLLPPWALEGGTDAALERLRDPSTRARIRHQLLEDTTSWDNWWAFSDGWEGLRIAGVAPGSANTRLRGRGMLDVIKDAGVADPLSQEGFDVILGLLREEALEVSLVSFNNVEDNVALFLSQPHATVGSDALVNPEGHPHPRLYGTFPRVLGRFVRELGALSLPEAVAAMTSRAADVIGRPRLGRIAPGVPGDLVLFDPETIADRATYEEPRLTPVGVELVTVAGSPVVRHGELTRDPIAAAGDE